MAKKTAAAATTATTAAAKPAAAASPPPPATSSSMHVSLGFAALALALALAYGLTLSSGTGNAPSVPPAAAASPLGAAVDAEEKRQSLTAKTTDAPRQPQKAAEPEKKAEARGTNLTVSNSHEWPVDVAWLAPEGHTVPMMTVAPGMASSLNTFEGHYFVLSEAGTGREFARPSVLPGREHLRVDARFEGMWAPEQCADVDERCGWMVKGGSCVENPGWTIVHCARSCGACHYRSYPDRCDRSVLKTEGAALENGDLDKRMRAVAEGRGADGQVAAEFGEVTVHSTSPWVMTFDGFLTDGEADGILAQVNGNWQRSTDQGKTNEFGVQEKITSKGRTSQNAWCIRDCEKDPSVVSVMDRIERLLGVPQANYEQFQILRYEEGQYYRTHHDMGAEDNRRACGPRVYTMFLYLSDVEEGGGTDFPRLNITVQPKKGRALLWPSVLSDHVTRQDARTHHQALPVGPGGLKYAANAWIHLYDFRKANLWGCTGAFD